MRPSKRTVKWLDSKFFGVLIEALRAHQRKRSQASHVRVVDSSTVVEVQFQSGIAKVGSVQLAVVDQQCAGESWLHDDSVAGVQIEYDKFRTPPAAHDRRPAQTARERTRAHLTKYVRFFY